MRAINTCQLLAFILAFGACKKIEDTSSLAVVDYDVPELKETEEKCFEQKDESWMRLSELKLEGLTVLSIDDDICNQYFGDDGLSLVKPAGGTSAVAQPRNLAGQPVILVTNHTDPGISQSLAQTERDLTTLGFNVLRVDGSRPSAQIEQQVAQYRQTSNLSGRTAHVLMFEHGNVEDVYTNPQTGKPFNNYEAQQQYFQNYQSALATNQKKFTDAQLAAWKKKYEPVMTGETRHIVGVPDGTARYSANTVTSIVRGLGIAKTSTGTQGAAQDCVVMTDSCHGGQLVNDANKPGAFGGTVEAGKVAVMSASRANQVNYGDQTYTGSMLRTYMRAQIDPSFQQELIGSTSVRGADGKPINTVTTAHVAAWSRNGYQLPDRSRTQAGAVASGAATAIGGYATGNYVNMATGLVRARDAVSGTSFQQGYGWTNYPSAVKPQSTGKSTMPLTSPITKISPIDLAVMRDRYVVPRKPPSTVPSNAQSKKPVPSISNVPPPTIKAAPKTK